MLYDKEHWEPQVKELEVRGWRKVLLDAADLIELDGWSEGSFRDGRAVCAYRAVLDAGRTAPPFVAQMAVLKLRSKVHALQPDLWWPISRSITRWNDQRAGTQRTVVNTLREVARK